MDAVRKRIVAALKKQGLADAVQFQTKEQRGLVVNIVTDRVLFDLGEATLRPQGARVLGRDRARAEEPAQRDGHRGAHRQPADQRRAVRLQLGAVHATRNDRAAPPADPRARRAQGRRRRVRRPAPAASGTPAPPAGPATGAWPSSSCPTPRPRRRRPASPSSAEPAVPAVPVVPGGASVPAAPAVPAAPTAPGA